MLEQRKRLKKILTLFEVGAEDGLGIDAGFNLLDRLHRSEQCVQLFQLLQLLLLLCRLFLLLRSVAQSRLLYVLDELLGLGPLLVLKAKRLILSDRASRLSILICSISLTSAIFSFFFTSVFVGLEHLGGMVGEVEEESGE